ncbi:MAG: hypothetical protein Q9184_005438 [Pyrenodesmia sp. 2 TL-2023]
MEVNASAGLFLQFSNTPNLQSQQRLPSPLPDLVERIRKALASRGTVVFSQELLHDASAFLNQTPPPIISRDDITALVKVLDHGTPDIWSRLDDTGFTTVYAFLRTSEPCLAHQRGHCLFTESLYPSRATTAAQKAALVTRKSDLGQNVVIRLLRAFLDSTLTNRARRWIGSLLLELLRDCHENKEIFAAEASAPLRSSQALGNSILSSKDEIVRLVAGTIIREMVNTGLSTSEFLPADKHSGLQSIFLDDPDYTSQWTTDFVEYIDGLDTQGRLTPERAPSFFAYGLSVDDIVYNTEYGLSILVTVTDELTIVIPSTDTEPVKYIDIPLNHVGKIQVAEGGAGSQPRSNPEATPAALAFHLLDTPAPAYYLNESVRASCGFNLAFDTINDAESLKAKIEAHIVQQRYLLQQNSRHPTTLSSPKVPKSPTLVLSQSIPLNISQHDQDGITCNQVPPTSHDLRSMKTTTGFEARDQVNRSSANRPSLPIEGDERGPAGKGQSDRSLPTGVSVARHAVNVSQEVADRDTSSHEINNCGNTVDIEPTGVIEWHDGMNLLEHAKEFKSIARVLDAPVLSEIVDAATHPQAEPRKDGDLDTASKTHQVIQRPKKPTTEVRGEAQIPAAQNAPSETGTKTFSNKLSRSMRVEGEERSSAALFTRRETMQSAQDVEIAIAKRKPSLASRSSNPKRKVFDGDEAEAAGPSKRLRAQDVHTQKNVLDVSERPGVASTFDIPLTPPSQARKGAKPYSSAKNNSRAVNGKRKAAIQEKAAPTKVAKKRPAKTQQPTQRKSKNKVDKATASAPKRPTRNSRAAARKAMDQMRVADDESEVEEEDLASQLMDDEAIPKAEEMERVLAINVPKRPANGFDQGIEAPEPHTPSDRPTAARKEEQPKIQKPKGMLETGSDPSPHAEQEQVFRKASPAAKQDPQAKQLSQDLSDQQHTEPGEPIDYTTLRYPAASLHPQYTTSTARAHPLITTFASGLGAVKHVPANLGADKLDRDISESKPVSELGISHHLSAVQIYGKGVQTGMKVAHSDDAIQPPEPDTGGHLHDGTRFLKNHGSQLKPAQEDLIQITSPLEGDQISHIAINNIPTIATDYRPFAHGNRIAANDISGSQLPSLRTPGPSNIVTAEVKEPLPQASTPHSRINLDGGYASTLPQRTTPKPLLLAFEMSEDRQGSGPMRQSMAPARVADKSIVSSRIPAQTKRSSDDVEPNPRKKVKRTPEATRAPEQGSISTKGAKDPRRIPQIINFSAKGPRNQGKFSPAFGFEAARQYEKPEGPNLDPSSGQRRKRDFRTVIATSLNSSGMNSPKLRRLHEGTKAYIEDGDMPVLPDYHSAPEPSVRAGRHLDQRAQGALLRHSSLFPADSMPKISSQGSRVNEHGSPLPSQRTRNVVIPRQKLGVLDAASDIDIAEAQFQQDETTIVQDDDDEAQEYVLPSIPASTAPTNGRKKHVGFVGSSNSKHRPSSPSAPSEMLAAFQPHTAEAGGQFVNVQTEAVLIPSKPQDPFASQPAQKPNHFLDKLRRATYTTGVTEPVEVRHTISSVLHKDAATMTEKQDLDETLVANAPRRPRRRRQETPLATDLSSTSSSERQSSLSEARSPLDKRWLAALEPHQEDMLAVLYEISHNLVGHLVDVETAINDVVKDYQRRGERMVKALADDLERELQQYISATETRREDELKRYEELQRKVLKNLQRKPQVEDLTKQLEERQSVLDAQMQEAMDLCARGIE